MRPFAVASAFALTMIGAAVACSSFTGDAEGNAEAGAAPDGQQQTDADPSAADATVDSDAGPLARCNPTAAFATIEQIDLGPAGKGQLSASLSSDESRMVFTEVSTSFKIMSAKRGDGGAFDTPAEVPFSDVAPSNGASPHLSDDGLELHYSDPVAGGGFAVFRTRRNALSDRFPAAIQLITAGPGEKLLDARPFEGEYVLRLELSQNAISLQKTIGGASLAPLLAVPEPATNPVVAGGALYFAAVRGATFDIVRATRRPGAATFELPVDLTPNINTGQQEMPNWVSADECVLYFTRTLGNPFAFTEYRIFRAVRAR